MKRFLINLPDELYRSIRQQAFNMGVSMSKFIVDSLKGAVPLTPKQDADKLIVDAAGTQEANLGKVPKTATENYIKFIPVPKPK